MCVGVPLTESRPSKVMFLVLVAVLVQLHGVFLRYISGAFCATSAIEVVLLAQLWAEVWFKPALCSVLNGWWCFHISS